MAERAKHRTIGRSVIHRVDSVAVDEHVQHTTTKTHRRASEGQTMKLFLLAEHNGKESKVALSKEQVRELYQCCFEGHHTSCAKSLMHFVHDIVDGGQCYSLKFSKNRKKIIKKTKLVRFLVKPPTWVKK